MTPPLRLDGSPAVVLFDAVFFDLDGTLIATDRFWLEAAGRGARRAFTALGRGVPLPTPEQWLALVGLPLEVGFRGLFPELTEPERQSVLRACVEEEEALLRREGVPVMPGAKALLRALHECGLVLGIASNCQRAYLDHMLDGLGLRTLVRGAYCRESPGIESKGDMVARLLADVGTRSALVVGDRASDRDAAWENGLPHVHCAFGFAQGDEDVEAEGRLETLADLLPLLAQRGRWIEGALLGLGAFERPGLRLGITGGPAAGKTLFARDAARVLRARGQPAAAVSLADFAAAHPERGTPPPGAAIDFERLERELLGPHEGGAEVPLVRPDLLGQGSVPAGATLVLEGAHLLGARRRLSLDRLVQLRVSAGVALRRLRGRADPGDPRQGAPRLEFEGALALEDATAQGLPAGGVDLVLDGSNPLGRIS